MFHKASSVCFQATAKAASRKQGGLRKDGCELGGLFICGDEVTDVVQGILPGLPSISQESCLLLGTLL